MISFAVLVPFCFFGGMRRGAVGKEGGGGGFGVGFRV